MFITTILKSETPSYRLHRDNCKGLNGSQRTIDDMLAEDPKAVLESTPCSQCSPSKAATFSVHRSAQDILDAANKKAEKAATRKEKTVSDTETTPKAPRTLAATEGTQKCEGACGKTLPLTAFPTRAAKPGEVPARGKVCRADLKAAREAKATESK